MILLPPFLWLYDLKLKDRGEREGERREGVVREEIPFYDHSFIESTSAEILKRGNCDTASSPHSKPPNESRHPMTIHAFSEPALPKTWSACISRAYNCISSSAVSRPYLV